MKKGLALRRVYGVMALMGMAAGCGRDQGSAPASDSPGVAAVDTATHAVEWKDLATRSNASSSVLPVDFRASTSELRVITHMGATISPYSPGRVTSNILSKDGSLPLASVRAEQNRLDSVTVDTTKVSARPGDLQLFIAERRGLREWQVLVQEKRRPSS